MGWIDRAHGSPTFRCHIEFSFLLEDRNTHHVMLSPLDQALVPQIKSSISRRKKQTLHTDSLIHPKLLVQEDEELISMSIPRSRGYFNQEICISINIYSHFKRGKHNPEIDSCKIK